MTPHAEDRPGEESGAAYETGREARWSESSLERLDRDRIQHIAAETEPDPRLGPSSIYGDHSSGSYRRWIFDTWWDRARQRRALERYVVTLRNFKDEQ